MIRDPCFGDWKVRVGQAIAGAVSALEESPGSIRQGAR